MRADSQNKEKRGKRKQEIQRRKGTVAGEQQWLEKEKVTSPGNRVRRQVGSSLAAHFHCHP